VPEKVLLGLALQELAKNVPDITNLTVTPDMVTALVAKLTS